MTKLQRGFQLHLMAGSKCHAVKFFAHFHYAVTWFSEVQQIKLFDASKLCDSNCVGAKISTDLIVLTCAVFAHEFSRFANFPSAENVTSFVVTVFG